jgi:hypothetical protein
MNTGSVVAHHVKVLAEAGIIVRAHSEGGSRHELSLDHAAPRHTDQVLTEEDLVIAVYDNAHEQSYRAGFSSSESAVAAVTRCTPRTS